MSGFERIWPDGGEGRGAALDARTVEGWTPLALANGLSYSDFFKAQTHTADRCGL